MYRQRFSISNTIFDLFNAKVEERELYLLTPLLHTLLFFFFWAISKRCHQETWPIMHAISVYRFFI